MSQIVASTTEGALWHVSYTTAHKNTKLTELHTRTQNFRSFYRYQCSPPFSAPALLVFACIEAHVAASPAADAVATRAVILSAFRELPVVATPTPNRRAKSGKFDFLSAFLMCLRCLLKTRPPSVDLYIINTAAYGSDSCYSYQYIDMGGTNTLRTFLETF